MEATVSKKGGSVMSEAGCPKCGNALLPGGWCRTCEAYPYRRESGLAVPLPEKEAHPVVGVAQLYAEWHSKVKDLAAQIALRENELDALRDELTEAMKQRKAAQETLVQWATEE